MRVEDYLAQINKDREQIEAPFVFSLWSDPDLYDDYKSVNEGTDETLITEDAQFYFNLGKALYKNGYRTFDDITIHTFLKDKPKILSKFEEYGGYHEVKILKDLVNPNNVDAYFDKIVKLNTLTQLCKKNFEIFDNVENYSKLSSQEIYDIFDYTLNSISIETGHDIKIEDLTISQEFIDECNSGEAVGLSYAKSCPLMNYLTLGIPLGEMFMLAGHSGTGKSSFAFENFILSLNNEGVKTAIISNEMRSNNYKMLLIEHILTKDLDYWEITRKKLKMGNFTDEQRKMLDKAIQISKEKYSNIRFVKLFDNDVSKVMKYIKKLSKLGYQVFLWDTMKADDSMDDKLWQQLMINSRKIFQLASKENISIVPTYQLALHTTNQRFLDAGCLSNSKQIKEVFSEMIYMRPLWEDEYTGGKYDCKVYKYKKNADGTRSKVKTFIDLDKDKKYVVAFLDKTRNDEDKQQVLYEWNGRFNSWKELGFCNIANTSRG